MATTSYERDAESGNDYAIARFHVNRLGRFNSPDPLGGHLADPQSLNRYAYVSGDPANMVDPLGLDGYCDASGCHATVEEVRSVMVSLKGGGGASADGWGFWWGGGGLSDPPGIPLIYRPGSDPGGGGGGGGSRDKAINDARSNLYDALLNDPDCLGFLGGSGASVLGTLSKIRIDHSYIGGPSIQAQTNNSTPGPKSRVPVNPSITINDNGWFFTRGAVAPNGTHSGTPLMQGGVLLHELGHATGVLLYDGQNAPDPIANQAINDEAIKQHCAKTLNSLSNK